jgi:hypothetical protein
MKSGTLNPAGGRPIMHRGAWAQLTLVLATVLPSACFDLSDNPRPTRPMLRFQPSDQRSDVGEEALQVRLFSSLTIDAELVSRVAAGTELIHWPEMTTVAAQTDVVCCDQPGYGAGGMTSGVGTVRLRPLTPLDPSRWYAIAVAPQAHGLTLMIDDDSYRLPDGRALARFALDGPATVAAIRICEKTDGRSVYVDFSEPVLVGSQAPGSVAVEQDGVNCPGSSQTDVASDISLRFFCSGRHGWQTTKVVFRDVTTPSGEVASVVRAGGTSRESSATVNVSTLDRYQEINGCFSIKLAL